MERDTRDGMTEPDLFGMEIEAVGLGAIKLVTLDGHAQAVRMGAVDAQLMGTARLGIESDGIAPLWG